MKRALRKILRIGTILTLIVFIAVAAAVVLFFSAKPQVKGILEKQLAKRAGINVRAAKLDYSHFPFHLTAEDVKLGLEDDVQKVDLTLARLEARGDFWKLVRGRKPALDTIEASGAVLRFRQKAPPKGPVDYGAMVIKAADSLAWTRRVSITKAVLAASLIRLEASFEDVDISLAPAEERGDLAYSVRSTIAEVKDPLGKSSLRSGLTSSGQLRLTSSVGLEASLTLVAPRFVVDGIEGSPPDIAVESSALFDLAAGEFTFSRLKVSSPELLELEGTAKGKFGQGQSLEAGGTVGLERLENAAALIRPRLPAVFRQASLRGRAVFSGKYSLQRSAQGKSDELEGNLAFQGVELGQNVNGRPLLVRASGKVQAKGPSRALQLSADVRASVDEAVFGKLRVQRSDLHVVASGTKEEVNIEQLEAALMSLSLNAGGAKRLASDKVTLTGTADLKFASKQPIPASLEARFKATLNDLLVAISDGKRFSFDNVALKGKAGLDLGRKTVVLDALEVGFPGFPPLSVAGRAGLKEPLSGQARFEAHGVDLPALRTLAAPFIPKNLAGWDLAGAADFSVGVSRPSASGLDWGFSGDLSLTQVRLNDPSFTVASEGISPAIRVEGEYAPAQGLAFKSEVDISQGESLWKAVYVSWSQHPLTMTAAGRYDPGSGRMDGLMARFDLPTIGGVGLTGWAATRPSPSFDLRSDARLSLGALYSLYTQAGATGKQRLSLEGTLGAGLHLQKDEEGFSITGKLTLAGVNLERQLTKTVLRNVDAEVPVHLEIKKTPPDAPETPLPEEGFLRIAEFRNPLLSLNSLNIPLRVGVNAFSAEPFSVELYGGRAELGRTVFRLDPKARSIQGAGSLALRDLDISRVPIQSPQFKLTGKIRADFPRFDISRDEIILSGRGEASVFGGQVILRDLAISEPFSPGRSISLNLDLVDLDLKRLTDEVPFGEVTGIIRGEVRNLVITYRQPERFELLLESVPRKGVPQTFSLKAVDDLTVLSSGGQATAGTSRFWMRFIRGFRYRKLGIVSTLRNDTFTLNGTIHEGGLEYLVKKTPLFGISVVNRLPRNVISFKEMMSRLKRIGQSENVPQTKEVKK